MDRRQFIKSGLLAGGAALGTWPLQAISNFLPFSATAPSGTALDALRAGQDTLPAGSDLRALYHDFTHPLPGARPFVRWWWNGNKVTTTELIRELDLLKAAGIGGVEINPISFPSQAPEAGIDSLTLLSDAWVDTLKTACEHARDIGLTCDLLVGSGWPFGAETLPLEETAQVVLVYALLLEGPCTETVALKTIYDATDPQVTEPNPLRRARIISMCLAPDPMEGLDGVVDLNHLLENPDTETVQVTVPSGKHCLYAVVRVQSFASVINGAPGASGSMLDHLSRASVEKYLNTFSQTLTNRMGPLSSYFRAFFSDSMELEGCNWCQDFAWEFQQRNGYDLMPYLPFILFKVGRLGGVLDAHYGASKTPAFEETLQRVRFDFEFTKASLLKERFTEPFVAWSHRQGVQVRAQAYGRGFFPLESSLLFDIPEGESWTTNWLRHKPGEEMSDSDYRRGRAYTMIDKYVSSAAHLSGKRVVSCEEMTNTYRVFNASLELLKNGSDQSMMAGITHSVWHGFNYSPPEAPFPGWIQYGSYYNEQNPWWPYFHLLNDYKARIFSILQQSEMQADMAILPANYDLWAVQGVQTDPFPEWLNVPYTSLIWEAIAQNGGASDYITELILEQMTVRQGTLCYGARAYKVLFLPGVESIHPEHLEKLIAFASTGGRVFCIGTLPCKAPGRQQQAERDAHVGALMERLKACNGFAYCEVPENNAFMEWYTALALQYNLPHAVTIDTPSRFLMQVHYRTLTGQDVFLLHNAHRLQPHTSRISFGVGGRPWIWDAETGVRTFLETDAQGACTVTWGPTQLLLVVFEKRKGKSAWQPLPDSGRASRELNKWEVTLQHAFDAALSGTHHVDALVPLETLCRGFCGTATYRITLPAHTLSPNAVLNLGRVEGVSEVRLNGQSLGVQWFGRRVLRLTDAGGTALPAATHQAWSAGMPGAEAVLEVVVTTTMGNYLKTLKDNKVAQYWVNRPNREQDIEPLGLLGPVTIYQP